MSRREFTKPTKREALRRSGGKCEAVGTWYGLPAGQRCGRDLAYGVEFDHIDFDANSKDNSLENCAAVCPVLSPLQDDEARHSAGGEDPAPAGQAPRHQDAQGPGHSGKPRVRLEAEDERRTGETMTRQNSVKGADRSRCTLERARESVRRHMVPAPGTRQSQGDMR